VFFKDLTLSVCVREFERLQVPLFYGFRKQIRICFVEKVVAVTPADT